MRITTIFAIELGFLLALPLAGQCESGIQRPVFEHTSLRPVPQQPEDWSRYLGRVMIRGEAIAFWESYEGVMSPALVIQPDALSRNKLPHFKEMGPVTQLRFSNQHHAIAQIFGAERAGEFAHGPTTQVLRTTVIVTISDYSASIDCDQPSYTAWLVSLQGESTVASTHQPLSVQGCG